MRCSILVGTCEQKPLACQPQRDPVRTSAAYGCGSGCNTAAFGCAHRPHPSLRCRSSNPSTSATAGGGTAFDRRSPCPRTVRHSKWMRRWFGRLTRACALTALRTRYQSVPDWRPPSAKARGVLACTRNSQRLRHICDAPATPSPRLDTPDRTSRQVAGGGGRRRKASPAAQRRPRLGASARCRAQQKVRLKPWCIAGQAPRWATDQTTVTRSDQLREPVVCSPSACTVWRLAAQFTLGPHACSVIVHCHYRSSFIIK